MCQIFARKSLLSCKFLIEYSNNPLYAMNYVILPHLLLRHCHKRHEVDLSVARRCHVIWCKTCILFSKIVYSIICIQGDIFDAINCFQTLSTFVCKSLLHGIPPKGHRLCQLNWRPIFSIIQIIIIVIKLVNIHTSGAYRKWVEISYH